MFFLVPLWVFIAGLCIGSFLNVVIYRLQSDEHSFWTKRSYCHHCRKTIWIRDLIPLVSWVCLKGKCRFCQAPISFRYVLVELFIGLLALTCCLCAQNPMQAAEIFIFCTVLVAIGLIDLDCWMIPLQLPGIIALSGLVFGYFQDFTVFEARLIGLLVGLGVLAVLLLGFTWVFRRFGRLKADENAMGWGDPILLGAIGANLGWQMLSILVLLASVQGIALYGFFTWTRKPLPDDEWLPPAKSMPFGPFLALAAIEISLYNLIL